MQIQFRCNSVSRFDDRSGTYQHCNQLLQATDDIVGLKVRCPRCNQMTVVPGNAQRADDTGAPAESETVAQVQSTLSYGKFNRRTRCPKCGSPLDEQKKCKACRYETPLVKVSSAALKDLEVKPAGFQLWFRNIMSDGMGPRLFEVALHSLMFIVICLCCVAAIALGGAQSIFVILGAVFLAGFYGLIVAQTKRLGRVPGARLPFYMRPFWYLLLVMARRMNWQKYDSRLANRVIIDVRGEPFSDRDLLELSELNVCSVLDAEGTDLTDSSLAAMHGLKHLRCLVLRKTHVSHEAVCRLQQSLRQCWIWY